MTKEVKGLLQRLLWSIVKNGEAGIWNAFQDLNVENAEYEFEYAIAALQELKNLENGDEIDWNSIDCALDISAKGSGATSLKDKIKVMLDYGYSKAKGDFEEEDWEDYEERKAKEKELKSMYYPDDALISELVEAF